MKIQSIKNYYNSFYRNNILKAGTTNKITASNSGMADVISFSAKQYTPDSIVNPTNHCAYCGCKLYSEAQIDSIAKEIMSSRGARLEGKVKSVLEKLEEAKHSQELEVAKRMENKEEIDFFSKFLDIASKKSFLKGEEIFKQVYNLETEDAMNTLVANMHPLLKTIDHVSPQHEDKENKNSDINLVEACYCCNHDLKKGSSFNEFYVMFPTIKNNMPKEKFEYAMQQLLDSSQNQVQQRLSATNMLKLLERLFVQRVESQNALDSVDFRIKGCKTGISEAVESCRLEISQKEAQKSELEAKFEKLKQDPEFVAMLELVSLGTKLENANSQLEALRTRRTRIDDSINSLKGTQKKKNNKKREQEMSEEDKKARIEQLRADKQVLSGQIDEKETEVLEIEISIEELKSKFPTIEMLQVRKNQADVIVSAYATIEKEQRALEDKKARLEEYEKNLKAIQAEIGDMVSVPSEFAIDSRSPEEQEQYKHYKDLLEAEKYIDDHPNGGNIRLIIHSKAKEPIMREIAQMETMPVIVEYKKYLKKKNLLSQQEKVQKNIYDIKSAIHQSENAIASSKRHTAEMSLADAKAQSSEYAEHIRRANEKQNYIKMPQMIASVSTEILLLNQTISDLIAQQEKIETAYSAT